MELHRTREIGRIPGQHLSRNTGVVAPEPTAEHDEIDNDSNAGKCSSSASYHDMLTNAVFFFQGSAAAIAQTQMLGQSQPRGNGNSDYRKSGMVAGGFGGGTQGFSGAGPLAGEAQALYANDSFTNPKFVRSAGDFQKKMAGPGHTDSKSIGLTVKNTHTRHTDGTGVLVTRVEESSPAARAMLKAGDLVTSVANRPTSTVEQFREAVLANSGPITISVNRDGRRNVSVTLYR